MQNLLETLPQVWIIPLAVPELVEKAIRGSFWHSRLHQSIAGWTFLEWWLQKHLSFLVP
jgi:hypothetical protein